jgi:F420-dependent oxidoreductase-like protein
VTIYGVHAGLQNVEMSELRGLWRTIERLGFDWISVWDHFYAATGSPDDAQCLEAIATHAALACDTTRVTIGCLVYSVGYRHPAVLAKAITTIDHLSGGRAAMGLGAGWSEIEYDAYGIEFPSVKVRMDQLEEGVQCLRSLLHNDVTDFDGEWFTMRAARNEPRPVQSRLPVWIGGLGEQRTIPLAARHADGWNAAFPDVEQFRHKRELLRRHCELNGRDPAAVRTSVNVGLAWTEESLVEQFGALANYVRRGVLTGTETQVQDRIGEYVAAGADQINLALRAPFNTDDLERFAEALHLSG